MGWRVSRWTYCVIHHVTPTLHSRSTLVLIHYSTLLFLSGIALLLMHSLAHSLRFGCTLLFPLSMTHIFVYCGAFGLISWLTMLFWDSSTDRVSHCVTLMILYSYTLLLICSVTLLLRNIVANILILNITRSLIARFALLLVRRGTFLLLDSTALFLGNLLTFLSVYRSAHISIHRTTNIVTVRFVKTLVVPSIVGWYLFQLTIFPQVNTTWSMHS